MIRYNIVQGDKTTSGGTVVGASGRGIIDGRTIAVEGDLCTCPVCKSTGRILATGPRLPELWDGKQAALSGDIVLCKCPKHPCLLNSTTSMSQILEGGAVEQASARTSSSIHSFRSAPNREHFDEQFILVNEETDQPLANAEYAIRRSSGEIEHGVTDTAGCTHRLSSHDSAEYIEIFF